MTKRRARKEAAARANRIAELEAWHKRHDDKLWECFDEVEAVRYADNPTPPPKTKQTYNGTIIEYGGNKPPRIIPPSPLLKMHTQHDYINGLERYMLEYEGRLQKVVMSSQASSQAQQVLLQRAAEQLVHDKLDAQKSYIEAHQQVLAMLSPVPKYVSPNVIAS